MKGRRAISKVASVVYRYRLVKIALKTYKNALTISLMKANILKRRI